MKRLVLTVSTLALLIVTPARTASPFDEKLSADQQIVHALNRLTFGPRPGDVDEVRRMGLAKWIKLQLHPEQIPENPALDAKLKPLETLRMDLPAIARQYGQQPSTMMMAPQPMPLPILLGQEDYRKVMNGTLEERVAALKPLEGDKRKQVLAQLPSSVVSCLPDLQKEADEARKAQQEFQRQEFRKRNPQLNDLLNSDQISIARNGSKEQLTALFAYLDPEKRPQVAAQLPRERMAAFPELRREGQMQRQPQFVVSQDLKEAKVFRAIYSSRQLEEVLVDFWYNHFNVDQAKNVPRTNNNLVHTLIGGYERDAIRPHVLGHFKDLLLATARHPAMLYYLDNWQSMGADVADVGPFAPQRGYYNGVPNSILPSPLSRIAHGLNENYGRELMELHTLGVKGGYTQSDVIAVARAFTGWTVRSFENPEFVFAPFMHDFGEKSVLGHKIAAGGGEQDGLQVIDILAHHPSTATFISRKLAERFVADNPPEALVERMAQIFTKTDGDLRAVLDMMFSSPEFLSAGAWQAKIKSPLEAVVGAVRALGAEASDTSMLVQKIADLGEPLYNKLEPTGYPVTGESWLSTAGIMGRMNFSAALVSGMVPGITINSAWLASEDKSTIARDLLGREASPETKAAIEKGLDGKDRSTAFIASLVLGSPDFQRR